MSSSEDKEEKDISSEGVLDNHNDAAEEKPRPRTSKSSTKIKETKNEDSKRDRKEKKEEKKTAPAADEKQHHSPRPRTSKTKATTSKTRGDSKKQEAHDDHDDESPKPRTSKPKIKTTTTSTTTTKDEKRADDDEVEEHPPKPRSSKTKDDMKHKDKNNKQKEEKKAVVSEKKKTSLSKHFQKEEEEERDHHHHRKKQDSSNTNDSSKGENRKRLLRQMGQKANSLKFSALDFVALSPDKLKQHYSIGKMVHRGGTDSSGGAAVTTGGAAMISSQHSTNGVMSPGANIHKCLHLSTQISRAVKVVKKASTKYNRNMSSWKQQRIHQEFQILKALDHPSLVRVFEFFQGRDHYYIIMEYCAGGDLCQELDDWGRLAEEDAALLLKQVLTSLAYIHSNHIVHGNIKPEHILFPEHNKDLDRIKLTDFSCAGYVKQTNKNKTPKEQQQDSDTLLNFSDVESIFSLQFYEDSSDDDNDGNKNDNKKKNATTTKSTAAKTDTAPDGSGSNKKTSNKQEKEEDILPERLGTPEFWSPEVVLKGSTGTTKRDIWACGVLCYLVLSNQFPFRGDSREEICDKIVKGEFEFPGDSSGSGGDDDAEHDEETKEEQDFVGLLGRRDSSSSTFYSDYLDGDIPFDITFSWKDISDQAKNFIKQLLTYDEDTRPTALQALQHPWIVEMTSHTAQHHERQSSTRFSTTVPRSSLAAAAPPPETSDDDDHDEKKKSTSTTTKTTTPCHDEPCSINNTSLATAAALHNITLPKFNASNKLKQATLTFIAAQMVVKEERKAIDHIFQTLDIYKDGRLSRKEVQIGYKEVFKQELTEKELDDLFDRVDLNKTGYIEYSEFLVAAMNESDLLQRQKLKQAFSVFDRDASGTISKEDLRFVLNHFKGGGEEGGQLPNLQNPKQQQQSHSDPFQEAIDDEAIDKILEQADRSGDGEITYEDFMAMMLKTTDVEVDGDAGTGEAGTPSASIKKASLRRDTTSCTIESACSADNMKTLRFTPRDSSKMEQRPRELTDFYFIEDFIDEGGFGKVYVCRHKATNQERALKVIDKSRRTSDYNKKAYNEYQLLKGFQHPNIIKIFDLFEDKGHFFIVMNICKGGDLCQELDAWGKLSEANAAILMKQILSCLSFLHAKKIIHRDMKPDNILLQQSKDFRQVKVIDFGAATQFEDGVKMKERAGTAEYMAPEVIKRSYYGATCDIWSVGVICYLILSDKFPFKARDREELFSSIVAENYSSQNHFWESESVSADAKLFVKSLLTYDPKKRPTAAKALQHNWLADARRPRASMAVTSSVPSVELKAIEAADDSTRHALTNLQNFKRSRLQEAVRTFIASQLLMAEEKRAIDEVFENLDLTCNGKLSRDEVKAAHFRFFGRFLSKEELEDLFRHVDRKGTGFIEYHDFVIATMNEKVLLRTDKLRKAFELFDDDGNGLITASDLKRAFALFGEHDNIIEDDGVLRRLIKQVDADGDGKITYDEFVGAMMVSSDVDIEPANLTT